MATGSSFIPLFSQDDPVPYMYVAPPLTSNFEAACLEKMPLVDRIANAYQSIRETPDMPIFSWNRSGRSYKHITVWTHGFLDTMSRESLEYLIENPDVAEQVCDIAKAFLLLCWVHWALTTRPTSQLLLAELLYISTVFFGSSITDRIMALFREKHKASYGNGNYIHLNPYLSDLFITDLEGDSESDISDE
ncbi:hypothetical protein LEL_05771 [Akanthomyces lecanii RCEF 1005]|uniref:Uncharacterized protein n=1 Tax=Akanthomyces lecanii RCEF 1005 TaxID=1081108 RepID=A0A168G6A2_CORDF|nr:hypothetical protein LEL_05771 [Akanthomyces lecanii RCEF 1005]